MHNIIQIHNNVMWDRQYFIKYSSNSQKCKKYSKLFHEILSIPQNTVIDMTNVMWYVHSNKCWSLILCFEKWVQS